VSMINHASREIHCKVVYCGTGRGGKKMNLEHVYGRVEPDSRGTMVCLASEAEPTLFFDFLPTDVGEVDGFKTRFHLYSVTGRSYRDADRRLALKNADAVVFVADSQRERGEANVEAMHDLRENLEFNGFDLRTMPFAIQYNKRDLESAMSLEEMRAHINPMGAPDFEGVAREGKGVFETLQCVGRMVVKALGS